MNHTNIWFGGNINQLGQNITKEERQNTKWQTTKLHNTKQQTINITKYNKTNRKSDKIQNDKIQIYEKCKKRNLFSVYLY